MTDHAPVSRTHVHYLFEASHPDALAIYCSDGRFTDAIEELLHKLGHPRLDTLTMPGGPALLELTASSIASVDVVRQAASFLIEAHAIRHVVLIAHENCGYYRHRFPHDSSDYRVRRQHADLRSAGRWAQSPTADVKLFFARIDGEHVAFDEIALAS